MNQPPGPPWFASAISTAETTRAAAIEACGRIRPRLGGGVDLAFVFVSGGLAEDFDPLAEVIDAELHPGCLLGCTAESIVGNGREIEREPALSLWAASFGGGSVVGMHLELLQTAEGATFVGWPGELEGPWPQGAALMLLADPFTFPADALLERLNQDHPGVPVLGGMASGGSGPGTNRLLLGSQVHQAGAVAALVHGPVRVQAVVSQGCRPIGRPFVVTRSRHNVILELGGKPALARFEEVFQSLSPADQRLVRNGLHVGIVVDEYREQFGRGDFLVRNCVAADRETGALAIGDYLRTGQTVQFHVRDAATADEDLRELLAGMRQDQAALAALLFTCNGRGTRLFDQPHHDAAAVADVLGDIPVAGFFAQGELGPVGGKNFLHGFTASTAVFLKS